MVLTASAFFFSNFSAEIVPYFTIMNFYPVLVFNSFCVKMNKNKHTIVKTNLMIGDIKK